MIDEKLFAIEEKCENCKGNLRTRYREIGLRDPATGDWVIECKGTLEGDGCGMFQIKNAPYANLIDLQEDFKIKPRATL